jgi:hypothetical protein
MSVDGTFRAIRDVRNWILGIGLVTSTWIMVFLNAIAYSRMPPDMPLPDLVADVVPAFAYLRSTSYMRFQPTEMVLYPIIVATVLVAFVFWEAIDLRRPFLVYIYGCITRFVMFSVTSMPPACVGYPGCPCAATPWFSIGRELPRWRLALSYLLAAGHPTAVKIPQCGDLIVSGHTMTLWVMVLFLLDSFKRLFEARVYSAMRLAVLLPIAVILFGIVAIRNHWGIDVWLATLVTVGGWYVMSGLRMIAAIEGNSDISSRSWIVRVVAWFDEHPYERTPVRRENLPLGASVAGGFESTGVV